MDARHRMTRAALDLFAEQGYQATTVDEIAARAGVTQRTFFRHFGDKGEVLFDEDDGLLAVILGAVAAAPRDEPIIATVRRGLLALAGHLDPAREELRRRAAVIAAEDRLRERELLKLDRWQRRLHALLRERGVGEPDASLAVGLGAACFDAAYRSWLADRARAGLPRRVGRALDRAAALAGHTATT
ncbi:MAG: TetR/AcrR family transcriptional regulator [Kineosporiaceae bacterium]